MNTLAAPSPTGAIDPSAAIASGWRFVLQRPAVVLLWTLASWPPAVVTLWFVTVLFGGEQAPGGVPGYVPLAAVFLAAPFWVVIRAAAMRSVLQPDGDAFGYLRLGGREWALATMGWTRSPNNLPFGAIFGLLLVVLALVVLNIVVAPFGPVALLALNLAAAPLWLALVVYLNMRGALADVAAYSGVIDAQARAYERTKGHVGALSLMILGSRLSWLLAAALLAPVAVWLFTTVERAVPADGLMPGLPSPGLLAASIVLALVMALFSALCVRPSATAWRMLVGARSERNFLAEATG